MDNTKKHKWNNVKEIRWEKGLSTYDVSTVGGISQGEVVKVENGRIPNQKVMLKISKGLGVPTGVAFNLDWKNSEL